MIRLSLGKISFYLKDLDTAVTDLPLFVIKISLVQWMCIRRVLSLNQEEFLINPKILGEFNAAIKLLAGSLIGRG